MKLSIQVFGNALRRLKAAFTEPLPAPVGYQSPRQFTARPQSDGLWYVINPAGDIVAGPFDALRATSIATQANIDAATARNAAIRQREEMSRYTAG